MFKNQLSTCMIRCFYFFVIVSCIPVFAEYTPSTEAINQAQKANVLVAITVHFNPARLQYLDKMLSSLSTFPRADIILVTNTVNKQELLALQNVYENSLPNGVGGGNISIRSYANLGHPWELAWCHKEFIANEFLGNNKYSHFIYIEDDIDLNFMNFCYFVEFREILRSVRLLPSFLRVEYNNQIKDFASTDALSSVNALEQPHLTFGNLLLVNPLYPFMACFILDKELAAEYILTHSFDKHNSAFVIPWDLLARAAGGLCFENIPSSFHSRYLVPVCPQTGLVPKCAWISHLPNNYANNPATGHGKIPMNSVFSIH